MQIQKWKRRAVDIFNIGYIAQRKCDDHLFLLSSIGQQECIMCMVKWVFIIPSPMVYVYSVLFERFHWICTVNPIVGK